MATIGTAIESGSVQTVLLDATSGEILAHSTTSLEPDVTVALPRAVSDMRAEAATLEVPVDAVGVVYRSESERSELEAAIGDESMVFTSASQSFLSWLPHSTDFADAGTVLLYYMGESGVAIALADAADGTLTQAKNAALASMSPERIGSTIPLAWEVVDESGKKPQFVALFGDKSSNRDLIDILSLGLGVPVVRVGDADQVAARGAAWLASAERTVLPASVVAEQNGATVDHAGPTNAPDEAAEPAAESMPVAVVATLPTKNRSSQSGRKLIFAAVLLAGVASAGVAVAATLPSDAGSTAEQNADRLNSGADLAGATRHVDPTNSNPIAAVPPVAPMAASPETIPPPTDPAADTSSTVTTQPWTTPAWTPQPWTPRPGVPQSPAPAPATVDPPQFTVPAVVPEPGKTQEQLEREAWDRHWQQTGEWLEQELAGG